MKIAVVQFCPFFSEKIKNVNILTNYIDNIVADVIIFPELSTSGYFFESREELYNLSENHDGHTFELIQDKASNLNKIIIYGYPELENNKIYNSSAIIFPEKEYSRTYRKTHLFYKEMFVFEPGNTGFFVIDYKPFDLKIGTMICYDWRFPEAARTLALKGADLIVCPSNLVTNVWQNVMPARAIENKVYFAVANRTGKEKAGNEELIFTGESGIWNYNGKPLAKAGFDEEKVLIAEIDPTKTRDKSFNDYNDLFKDRRSEFYKV